ncbi:hypothetical protein BBJ28_00002212 [Nothophytophthora sp. Chile5]|nr:hypothetical protein BBJ28_00002212 [Nothophytophthora sp. Chile5]
MRRRGGNGEGGRKRVGEHHDGSFGVYMSHKIQKLRGQNASFTDSRGAVQAALSPQQHAAPNAEVAVATANALFRDVHVYVDGYTTPSKEEIRQLLLMHGGGFEHYETGRPFLYAGFADPTQSSLFSLSGTSAPISGGLSASLPSSTAVVVDKPEEGSKQTTSALAQSVAPDGGSIPAMAIMQSPGNWQDERDSESEDPDEEGGEHRSITMEARQNQAEAASVRVNSGSKQRTNSTRDGPEFVRHYFAKSRLHHIGTWRTTFQQQAAEFQAKYKGEVVERASPTSSERVILHVDMDCFFVAVAVRDRPDLQNVPIAVAHSENAGSSEVSSCNYLARAKGVGAGMFMQTAKELCPELVVLPYKFDAIERVSFQIYDIFFSQTPYVQAVSCDEAFLEFGKGIDGLERAKAIRQHILTQTGCAASVGVSFNVLLAKLASKKAKPDGIHQIGDPEQAQEFVLSLKIRDLPGVGYRTGAKIDDLGVETVSQLLSIPKDKLLHVFGKVAGETLFNSARGIDVRLLSIESNMMRKSVSAVVNFGIRFDKWEDATVFLMALGEELSHRLRSLKVRAKCLTLLLKKRREGQPIKPAKFMGHGVCDSFSKSQVLAQATDDDQEISKVCIELLRQFNFPSEELRGVGIQGTKLVSDAPSGSGQLIRAWLVDSGQPAISEASPPSSRLRINDGEAKSEDNASRNTAGERIYPAASFSQINMSVLEELPPSLRHEILASYGRGPSPVSERHKLQPKRRAKGKAPLQRKQPARNIFDCGNRRTEDASGSGNALNDIPMSQIDSGVYHSLPFAIQKEIDRYTKKRKPSSTVARMQKLPEEPSPDRPRLKNSSTIALPSIEDLFDNLVCSLQTAASNCQSEDFTAVLGPQTAAFDAIYSRILLEVENRTLDRALRMLRFVRRKCSSVSNSELFAAFLESGFNQVLDHVNRDIRRHFNGVLSSRVVAPLP